MATGRNRELLGRARIGCPLARRSGSPQPYRVRGEQTVATSETVLVTESGCETLTQFERALFQK